MIYCRVLKHWQPRITSRGLGGCGRLVEVDKSGLRKNASIRRRTGNVGNEVVAWGDSLFRDPAGVATFLFPCFLSLDACTGSPSIGTLSSVHRVPWLLFMYIVLRTCSVHCGWFVQSFCDVSDSAPTKAQNTWYLPRSAWPLLDWGTTLGSSESEAVRTRLQVETHAGDGKTMASIGGDYPPGFVMIRSGGQWELKVAAREAAIERRAAKERARLNTLAKEGPGEKGAGRDIRNGASQS